MIYTPKANEQVLWEVLKVVDDVAMYTIRLVEMPGDEPKTYAMQVGIAALQVLVEQIVSGDVKPMPEVTASGAA